MYLTVYDDGHVIYVVEVLRLKPHIKDYKKLRNFIHSNSNFLFNTREIWRLTFCEMKYSQYLVTIYKVGKSGMGHPTFSKTH